MRRVLLSPLLISFLLPACVKPLPPIPARTTTVPARDAFTAAVAVTRFSMLPADPANPMTGSSTFGGRCSAPSAWVATFDVQAGNTPFGKLAGNGSHCSRVVMKGGVPDVTYADGRVWLRLDEDMLFLAYANGVSLPPDAHGMSMWRDEWTVTRGTGRFAGATGAGVDSGTVHMPDFAFPPFTIRGTIARAATPPAPHPALRGTMEGEWTLPYLASGRLEEDPCTRERGAGWMTGHVQGRVSANIGAFTIEGGNCIDPATGEQTPSRGTAISAAGERLEWELVEDWWDFPTLVPGLERGYTYLLHNRLTGANGAHGEYYASGVMDARWQRGGVRPLPLLPWKMRGELTGWFEPAVRTQ